jgi:hypothetical protein
MVKLLGVEDDDFRRGQRSAVEPRRVADPPGLTRLVIPVDRSSSKPEAASSCLSPSAFLLGTIDLPVCGLSFAWTRRESGSENRQTLLRPHSP